MTELQAYYVLTLVPSLGSTSLYQCAHFPSHTPPASVAGIVFVVCFQISTVVYMYNTTSPSSKTSFGATPSLHHCSVHQRHASY